MDPKIERNVQRMLDQNAPDEDIVAYLAGEGLTPQEYQDQVGVPAGASDMGHIAGQGYAGISDVAGFPVDAMTGVLNAGVWGANQLGADMGYIEDPVGGSQWINQNVMDPMVANGPFGLWEGPESVTSVPPATTTGEVVGGALRGTTGAVAGMGLAAPLAQGGGSLGNIARLLTEQPGMQMATSAGAGAAMGGASAAGMDGPAAQLAAAMVGAPVGYGAGRAAGWAGNLASDYLYRPFTQSGQEQLAGQSLRSFAQTDPEDLMSEIIVNQNPAQTPGANPITPALTQDVGMATLARALQNQPNTGMPQALADRALQNDEAYREALGEIGGNMDRPGPAGYAMRTAYDEQAARAGDTTSQAYQNIDPNRTTAIPLDSIRTAADRAIRQHNIAARTEGVPPRLQAIIDRLQPGEVMNYDTLDTIQQELYDLASGYTNEGANNLAAVTQRVAGAVNDAFEAAATAGQGMEPGQRQNLLWARLQRTLQADQYETGPAQMFERDRYNRPETPNQDIPGAYMQSGYEGALQFGETLGTDPAARQGLVDFIMTQATTGTRQGGRNEMLRAESFRTFVDRLDPLFQGLRDSGALDPRHYDAIHRIRAELLRDSQAMRGGMASGSPTVQNLSIAGFLSRATGGVLAPSTMLGGAAAGSLDRIASVIYRRPEQEINHLLVEAMMDPQLAVRLLQRATPESLRAFENALGRRVGVSLGLSTAPALSEEEAGMSITVRPADAQLPR